MKFGIGEYDITPTPGVFQGGYGFRDRPSEGVRDPLAVVAAAWEHKDRKFVLIAFDLVSLGKDFVTRSRRQLAKTFDVAPGDIVFHWTHTHSAPEVRAAVEKLFGPRNEEYVQTLYPALESAVGSAMANMTACKMKVFEDTCDFNVYRRRFVNGQMTMAPNTEVPIDKRVRGLVFESRRGAPLGVLYTYNCHTNVLGDYELSADFPGYARANIKKSLECPSLYLQGCCGDIRPHIVNEEGTAFRRGDGDDVQRCGRLLSDAVLRGVKAGAPAAPLIDCKRASVSLPLCLPPSEKELRRISRDEKTSDIHRQWARSILKQIRAGVAPADRVPYEAQSLRMSRDTVLLFLQGEVVYEYAVLIERQFPHLNLWCHGYSHTHLNYIPTSHILAEGGYEASSYLYSTLPTTGAYKPGLEERIMRAVERLIGGI